MKSEPLPVGFCVCLFFLGGESVFVSSFFFFFLKFFLFGWSNLNK